MSRNKKLLLGTGFVFLFFVGFVTAAHAQVSLDFPSSFAGFSSQDLKTTIENIVRIVLGFVGIIFLILMLYGGFIWMTSGGDEKKITQAKKIIVSATVGLIITLASYAIATFIVNRMGGATGSIGGSGSSGPGGFGFALGSGILESHYPGRNATGVPRNTKIFVTFKEAIKRDSMCVIGGDGIWGTSDDMAIPGSIKLEEIGGSSSLSMGCFTSDNLTFKFTPSANLGNPSSDTRHKVSLTDQIEKAVTGSALPYGYSWQFTVSTITDTTPPTVVDVVPLGPPPVPRNAIVQITFSEAVDPTTVSGIYDGGSNLFDNIQLDNSGTLLSGTYSISNQYRTVEFVSNVPCGINSCGLDIFCLPASATINGKINGTGATAVVDMAGNILDGERTATYPPSGVGGAGGDFDWSFDTNSDLDLIPPFLINREPKKLPLPFQQNVSLTAPMELTFNERMSASSLKSGAAIYITTPSTAYWISVDNQDWGGIPGSIESKVYIHHDHFTALTRVDAGVNSGVKDLYQNCYYPASCDNSQDGVLTLGSAVDDPDSDGAFEVAECAF